MTPGRLPDSALAGCSIVVVADRRSADLAVALERRGATVQRAPALSILPAVDDDLLLARSRELIAEPPDIVVVTTGVGLRGWMDAVHERDLHTQLAGALSRASFIARGPKAHGAIQQAGFSADWVASSETAAEVAEHLISRGVEGSRIAVQHHGAGSDGLDALLTAHGATVVPLIVYRWGPPQDPDLVLHSAQQAASGTVDALLFTSAPGAAEWLRVADGAGALPAIRRRAESGRLLLAAVGPITAAPLHDAALRTAVAARGRLGALVRCVVEHFAAAAPFAVTPAGALEVRSGGALISGRFVPLSPASAGVLGALFDAGGRVLSREELGRVLPRGGRSPHAVEMAVARLREALSDRHAVRTVVKRGYRLALDEHG